MGEEQVPKPLRFMRHYEKDLAPDAVYEEGGLKGGYPALARFKDALIKPVLAGLAKAGYSKMAYDFPKPAEKTRSFGGEPGPRKRHTMNSRQGWLMITRKEGEDYWSIVRLSGPGWIDDKEFHFIIKNLRVLEGLEVITPEVDHQYILPVADNKKPENCCEFHVDRWWLDREDLAMAEAVEAAVFSAKQKKQE